MIALILFTLLALLPVLVSWRNPYFLGDLKYSVREIQIRKHVAKLQRKFSSLLDRFLEQVKKHPQKKFLVFEDSSYTYSQADRESSKVARALRTHAHLKEGDTVALFLGNQPQFVWVWLGLAKLGCVASLLNTNIRSKSLLHCFSCCEASVLIAAAVCPNPEEVLQPPGPFSGAGEEASPEEVPGV
uniref:Long-chain-fatty-acid--CoA ligase n=1 Tax=Kryptolebias marmoratus TaxID=37003 RepID=A0A3Q3EYN0_KRYMA